MSRIIAIIPARGGSKRLPRKNILPLGGVPLLSRVIRTARNSDLFDKIVVSSEDDEILMLAKKEGAIAHARPVELASDRSTVVDVCVEALGLFPSDFFCCIYPTAAMISRKTLDLSSRSFFSDKSKRVLMGVSEFNHHPTQALTIDEFGNARLLFPEYERLQSQFYPIARVSNGTFYWAEVGSFLIEKTFYSNSLSLFDVPQNEAFDLDTPDDYDRLVGAYEASL